jgi:hypothetical protein
MLGAAFAVGLKVPDRLKPAASLTGIALIAAAVVTITEADSFPGWLALLPTIGTALVIGGGPNGPASRALSLRPLVYVGKVSYSFYLWHWPVFVFLRHFRAELELPPALSAAGILFAFLLSVLSYRWIERPARDPRTVFRAVWLPALAAAVIILALSALVIAGKGLPQRLPPRVVGIAAEREAFAPLARACTDVTFDHATTHCHLGPRGEPRFLLLGDSRAAAISEAVESAIAKPGIVISNGSCAPTLGWVSPALKGRERSDCISTNERALAWSASNPDVDIVVLDALWPDYAQEGGTAFWSSAQQVVDRLNAGGKRVFVIAGEPSAAVDVPWASAIREQFGRKPLILNCPKGDVHLTGVTVIDVSAAFCHGVPYRLLTDSSHPSRYAGLTIITPALRGAMAQRH